MSEEETNEVSELRKAAEGGKAAKAEAALARKELAFVKAGINTDTKPAQALLRAYDGDLDAEAIRAEAKEWSLLPGDSEPEPEPEVDEAPSAAMEQQEMRDALDGRVADTQPKSVGGVDAAFKQFEEDREEGRSMLDATNRAFGAVIKAAAQGDSQARFDPQKWEEAAAQSGHGAEHAR